MTWRPRLSHEHSSRQLLLFPAYLGSSHRPRHSVVSGKIHFYRWLSISQVALKIPTSGRCAGGGEWGSCKMETTQRRLCAVNVIGVSAAADGVGVQRY